MQVANKSRQEMAKFISLAESTGAAILIICHPNKQSGNNDLYRVSGSLDIVAASRSAMYLREVDDKLALCQIKSNLGPKASSIEVMISEDGCVSFGDLLEEPERPLSAVENAARFLVAQLSNGPLLSDEVHALAKIMGISKSSIDRAKKFLGSKIGARKRSDGAWELHLMDNP